MSRASSGAAAAPAPTLEVDVCGIPVRPFASMDDAVRAIMPGDGTVRPGFAVAINAEKVLAARRDPLVRETLLSGTLRYADGAGVVLAMRRKGVPSSRIPGCELWERLVGRAAEESVPVFLLGGRPHVVEEVKARLEAAHPGIRIAGARDGYFRDDDEVIAQIAESGARFVSVAMGSPRQERFIARCRERVPEAFYMGVGGTYDAYVGAVRRAPPWVGRAHLEWLYRALRQPRRLPRAARAAWFGVLALLGRV